MPTVPRKFTLGVCVCVCTHIQITHTHNYKLTFYKTVSFSYRDTLPEVKVCQHFSCGSPIHHWQLLFGHVISIECDRPCLDVHNIAGLLKMYRYIAKISK